MKKFLFLLAALLISLCASAKSENDSTVCFRITPAMSCGNCETKIKTNLRFEKGVTAIEAMAPGDKVTITFNRKKTDVERIVKAFSKIGYEAVPCTAQTCPGQHPCEPAPACPGHSCAKPTCPQQTCTD